MPKVIIYSTPTCGYCKIAKAFFQQHNVAFEEKDVTVDMQAREELIQTGQTGVPVIKIDEEIVIGFDKAKLSTLLGLST